MPEAHAAFSGTVLHRQQTGESHLRIEVASPELGLQRVLARQSKRSATPPDLFDTCEFMVDQSKGGSQFLKEFNLQKRRTEIARHYTSFEHACEFAHVFRKNLQHLEDPKEPVALLERALDAFAEAQRPDATLFKSLYLLARMEGFPVKEEWLNGLATTQRHAVANILQQPLSAQSESQEAVTQLLHSLRNWLKGVDFAL